MLSLPAAAALVARLQVVASTGSTNADLLRAAAAEPDGWPAPSVLASDHQTAGRGRLGRSWSAPAGTSLAVSVLLRPRLPAERLGWLSLAAGAAMTANLRELGVAASAKWPNDVLIGDRKVCGVLAQALPDGGGVVIGAGLNHAARPDDLPVPTATSLAIEGGPQDPDLLVSGWLRRLLALAADFEAAGGDADAGLRGEVLAVSGTVGRAVRVALPDGSALVGTAVDVDAEGRVVVDAGPMRGTAALPAGDVEHLRYE